MAGLDGNVTLPGLGEVKKKHLAYGGAALGAVVVFAYYRRARELAAGDELAGAGGQDDIGLGLGEDPAYTPGPGGIFEQDDTAAGTGHLTNSSWFKASVEYLIQRGYDEDLAAAAIGDFLDRREVTAAQAVMIRIALGAEGPPPQYGPWDIRMAQDAPAAVALPAPIGLVVVPTSDGRIEVRWQPVTGATGYDVELIAGVSTVVAKGSTTSTTWRPSSSVALRGSSSYRANVWAKNSQGKRGAKATAVGKSGSRPKAEGMRITGLKVEGSNRTDITWRWNAVPGAKAYGVQLIQGVRTEIHRTLVTSPRYNVHAAGGPQLRPGHSYRVRVQPVDAYNGVGPSVTLTARTKS